MIHRTFSLAAIVLATAVQATGQDAKPLRVYFVGNSVTDTINYGALAELAKSRGYQQIWGRHMIPGAPLQWIWEHPQDGFQAQPFGYYPTALPEHQWDVLSLQPFDRHLDGRDGDLTMAKNFIDLVLTKSLDVQVYVYARWPRQGKDDFDTAWLKKYTGGWGGYEGYGRLRAEALVQNLATAETADVPKIIEDLSGYYQWAAKDLSKIAISSDDPKARLHASLALLQVDTSQIGSGEAYGYRRCTPSRHHVCGK